MTRKMSAYARNMRRRGEAAQHYQGAAWLNTIQSCRTYSPDAPEWSGLAGNMTAATDALLIVRGALDDMLHHRVQPDDSMPFDLLAHAIDVAHIRAIQIQPDEANPAHAPLAAAKNTLQQMRERRHRTGRWGLAGPDRAVLADAINLYEQILLASSPAQMHKAATIRYDAIQRGKVWSATAS
ncbi:MAG: hypothetical protein KGZ67_12545 [Hydrogenophaga sp.]|jgi:hypothetical protein|nr:hypothetical protein [Hydrogenophaga sp.]